MPTYEYACDRCGIVEVFQSIKAKALTKCPQCKAGGISRLISGGSGVMFTGTGFWETDYNRSSDYQTKAQQDTAPSPETSTVPKAAPATKPAPTKPASSASPAPAT